ncbi:MAG: hypothetical protein AB7U95_00140 [Reyranella sp.]
MVIPRPSVVMTSVAAARKSWRRTTAGLAAVLLMLTAAGCGGTRERPRDTQTVDGVAIYLGVMPAALVSGHPVQAGAAGAMHGGTPNPDAARHVVIALFDARTGARIQTARVRAAVARGRTVHDPDRDLEPMQIAGVITFGNFFPMPQSGDYRIRVEIVRPGAPRPIEAEFDYRNL